MARRGGGRAAGTRGTGPRRLRPARSVRRVLCVAPGDPPAEPGTGQGGPGAVGRGAAERGDETLAAFEKRVSRTAEDRCLVETLEVRDALVRGQDAAVCLRDRRRLFARPPRGVGGVVEGYELAIRRLDRLLSRFDVRRVETVGQPFDGRVMHAVEARRVDRIGDGVVVEELRSGFVRHDDVLRLADVAVNRRHAGE